MARRPRESRILGRYALFDELAAGGVGTVHLGRLLGPAGFARTVAIKRLHAQYAKDPDFVSMFLDEARLAARVRHPNVVSMVDVLIDDGEMFLVMDYVHGCSLATLWRSRPAPADLSPSADRVSMPLPVAAGIVAGALHGLHAAHEARDEHGEPLQIVHRDVSPQNILVGTDGITRVVDFGVARATRRLHTTRDGSLKGKLRYMAPEQLRGEPIDRRVDVFSAAVVLWELITGRRLFAGEEQSVLALRMLSDRIDAPRTFAPELPPALDELVMRGLAFDRELRFATARDMALALEEAIAPATARGIGDWLERTAADELTVRAAIIDEMERAGASGAVDASPLPPIVADRIDAARRREVRAHLRTEVSLPAGAPPTAAASPEPIETTTSSDVSNPAAPRRSWTTGLGVGIVVAGAAFAVWMARSHGAAVASEPLPPPASPPRLAESAFEGAPLPEPPAAPEARASAPIENSAAPVARSAPTARTLRAADRPAATGKSTVCMKRRADGIIYFEPCP